MMAFLQKKSKQKVHFRVSVKTASSFDFLPT